MALSAGTASPLDLDGKPVDVFAGDAKARVLIFVRTDCPISNRYAPELIRLYREFGGQGVAFSLVYADPAETRETILEHVKAYQFPGVVIRDPGHSLVHRAKVTVTPETAVFSSKGALLYHGRIDNRYIELGMAMQSPTRHDLEEVIRAVLDGRPLSYESEPAIGCYLSDVE